MAGNPLLVLVFLPILAALLMLAMPATMRKGLAVVVTAYLLWLAWQVHGACGQAASIAGIPIFATDALAGFTLFFMQLLAFIILIFALQGVDATVEKPFFFWFMMTLSFCNGAVVSDHVWSFLTYWGLAGAALFAVALLGRTSGTPQTAKKTFIIIGGSDAFLLLGLALMLKIRPETNGSLSAFHAPLIGGSAVVAFIMLLIAAFAKAGGFPLHTWVPDFSKDAPVEGAALLPASLDKLLGIYLLARVMTCYFSTGMVVNLIVITLGALTVITAVMMAMHQHNGRRLLGYHAVSQVGYMIMGVGSGSGLAFAGGLFHLVNNTIYKSNLFLSLGAVEKRTGTNELDELGGISHVMPFTFLAALVGSMSISGIPPFNGFFSKWMIYQGLFEKTATLSHGLQIWLLLCIVAAMFGSALTLASFMKFIYAIFLGRRNDKFAQLKDAPWNQKTALALLSLFCIVFGLFAWAIPLQRFIVPVVGQVGFALSWLGDYHPLRFLGFFLVIFAMGFALFWVVHRVRYDDLYLGGMSPEARFRFIGTAFYKEIREMTPLKQIYQAAENKWFDVYDLGSKAVLAVAGWTQKAHPGWLPLYVLMIIAGLLALLILL